jgi:hypothetical protein
MKSFASHRKRQDWAAAARESDIRKFAHPGIQLETLLESHPSQNQPGKTSSQYHPKVNLCASAHSLAGK